MEIQFIGQGLSNRKSTLGNILIASFNYEGFAKFTGFLAFAGVSGVRGLINHIKNAYHLTETKLILGIDLQGTSQEALELLLDTNIQTFIYHTTSPNIYHPKIWLFEGAQISRVIIGSSNLTAQAMFQNVEASIMVSFDNHSDDGKRFKKKVDNYFYHLIREIDPNLKLLTEQLVAELKKEGLIISEKDRVLRHERQKSGKTSRSSSRSVKKFPKVRLQKIPHEFLKGKQTPKSKTRKPKLSKSWVLKTANLKSGFLQTEASYHFPQGFHLGHLLFCLRAIEENHFDGTPLATDYIRFTGKLDGGRKGIIQRQTKYKLQALMELGLIEDARLGISGKEYELAFTDYGEQFSQLLYPHLQNIDLSFKQKRGGEPVWEMSLSTSEFNKEIIEILESNPEIKSKWTDVFLNMDAVKFMLQFLFKDTTTLEISKDYIYENFFEMDYVKDYCNALGIKRATITGAEHRCPFLLNVLHTLGYFELGKSIIRKLVDGF